MGCLLNDRIARPGDFGRWIRCEKVHNIAASVVLDVAMGIWSCKDNGHFAENHLEALAGQFDVWAY